MLYTATNLIFEAIKKDKNKATLFETFQSKILASDLLRLEYEVLCDVKKAKGKLNLKESNLYANHLTKKYSKRISQANYELRSKTDLLESFGVKIKNNHSLDNLISYDNKCLNESIIISYVHNLNESNISNLLKEKKSYFTGVYRNIIKQNDRSSLNRQLALVEGYSHDLNTVQKSLINESVKSIKDQSVKNFGMAVNKAFKLKFLTEGLFKKKTINLFESDVDYDAIEKKLNDEFRGKTISLGSVAGFDKVMIESTMKENGVFVLNFNMKTYPTDYMALERTRELLEIRNKLVRTKRTLVSQLIYQAGYDYFILDGSKFDVSINSIMEDKDIPRTGGAANTKFELILFIKDVMSLEEMKHDFTAILKNYYDYLVTYIPDNINSDKLMQNIEDSKSKKRVNRKRNEFERENDSILDGDLSFAIGNGEEYLKQFK